MAEYIYDRPFDKKKGYLIDGPSRHPRGKKNELQEIKPMLAKEIEAVFPEKKFIVRCNKNRCHILFEKKLTQTQENTLKSVIENHKNNS